MSLISHFSHSCWNIAPLCSSHSHFFLHFLGAPILSISVSCPRYTTSLEKKKKKHTTNIVRIPWLCEDERYVLSLAPACSSETETELLILPACPHSSLHTLSSHTPYTLTTSRYTGQPSRPISDRQKKMKSLSFNARKKMIMLLITIILKTADIENKLTMTLLNSRI